MSAGSRCSQARCGRQRSSAGWRCGQRGCELAKSIRAGSYVTLNPEADARRFAAEALVGKGASLAKASDVDSAVASLQRALELDPTLRLNPEADARRFAAEALVGKGRLLVRQSKVKDAIAAYAGAERLDPTLKISARSWNTLCRFAACGDTLMR